MLRTTGGGWWAADRAPRGGERWSRGEAIEVSAHKPGVQRHEGRSARLHNDGRLEVRGLRRGDGSHVDGSPEGIRSGHLVNVHHGLGRIEVLVVRKTVLGLLLLGVLVLRERVHLTVEGPHLGWVTGVVGVLSLRRGIRGIVCERWLRHGVGFHCAVGCQCCQCCQRDS